MQCFFIASMYFWGEYVTKWQESIIRSLSAADIMADMRVIGICNRRFAITMLRSNVTNEKKTGPVVLEENKWMVYLRFEWMWQPFDIKKLSQWGKRCQNSTLKYFPWHGMMSINMTVDCENYAKAEYLAAEKLVLWQMNVDHFPAKFRWQRALIL